MAQVEPALFLDRVIRRLPAQQVHRFISATQVLHLFGLLRRFAIGFEQHGGCHACGTVIETPSDLMDDLARRLREARGFELDVTHVALSGRCADCGEGT